MAFVFLTVGRAKKSAQRLSRALPGVKLSAIQEAIARAVGYPNWFDFERTSAGPSPSPLDQALFEHDFRRRVGQQIAALSEHLSLPDGDVQYALSLARLTGDRIWTQDDHLAIRAAAWRRGPLADTKPRGPGDLVKIRASGRPREFGYLVSYRASGSARVLLDDSILLCAGSEVVRPRVPPADFIPSRFWRPYGYWDLADGSQVVFSRDYFPMWRINSDQVERLEPWLWVSSWISQTYFHRSIGEANWLRPRAQATALDFLGSHGIHSLPILADAPLNLLTPGVETPEQAVGAEHLRRGSPTNAPSYATVRGQLAA